MEANAVKTYSATVQWETFGVAETPAEYVSHRPRLYLETTIPSYLTARSSRDLNTARLQRITLRWWNSWRTQFEILVSERVIEEAKEGHPEAAQRRMEILGRFPALRHNHLSRALTDRLMVGGVLPPSARSDAEHVSIASVHRIAYLLSWNCAHLANVNIASKLAAICRFEGYSCPTLCTPEQLLERYEYGYIS